MLTHPAADFDGNYEMKECSRTPQAGKLSSSEHTLSFDTQEYHVRSSAFATVVRKIDWHILPIMSLLYLASFLDRTNIGNAKIAGLVKELGLTGFQYDMSVTVFFFSYALVEMPSNLVLKLIGAKLWLPIIMVLWGMVCISMGFVTNYPTLIICRVFLGLFEGGLFPGVTYYLSLWYPRSMIALRVALFFSAATIAGAFGGLLAYALEHLDGHLKLSGWQWIFIVEGAITIAVAIAAYFMIPGSIQNTIWLSRQETQMIEHHIAHDGDLRVPMDDEFRWEYVIAAFLDWKFYVNLGQYFPCLAMVYSVALSLPSIVKGLGYTTVASAQLHTIPVYVVACIFVVFAAWSADRFARSPVIIGFLCLAIIGWTLATVLEISNEHGRYAAMFLASIGAYSAFPVVVVSLTGNVGGKTKRATIMGLQVGIGGLSGAVTPWLFRPQDAPGYKFGCQWNIILGMISISFTGLNWFLLILENRRKRQAVQAMEDRLIDGLEDAQLSRLGDKSPFYLYTY